MPLMALSLSDVRDARSEQEERSRTLDKIRSELFSIKHDTLREIREIADAAIARGIVPISYSPLCERGTLVPDLLPDFEALERKRLDCHQRIRLLTWLIRILIRLAEVPRSLKNLLSLEIRFFRYHGTGRPPRVVAPLRPALGY